MVLVISGQEMLNLHQRETALGFDGSAVALNFFQGLQQRLNALDSHTGRKIVRGGFKWHLVVSQCGMLLKRDKNREALKLAIDHFFARSGIGKVCRTALLCDSDPEACKAGRIATAKVSVGPRGGLSVDRPPSAQVCSAGVAMGIILGRIRIRGSEQPFVVSYQES